MKLSEQDNNKGKIESVVIWLVIWLYDTIMQFRSVLCCHMFENTIYKFQPN